MNFETSDNDSSESEVFVIKQIKPVFNNSSQLVQLTLDETSFIKNSVKPLNNQGKIKNLKSKEKKRSRDQSVIKFKKIKKDVSGNDTCIKVLSKTKSSVKNKNNAEIRSDDDDIVVDKVKKRDSKNIQKNIPSYFAKKKDIKETAENVKDDSSLNIAIESGVNENLNLKIHELITVKNTEEYSVNETVITKEEKEIFLIKTGESENDFPNKEYKIEKSFAIFDTNLKKHLDLPKSSTTKPNLNVQESCSFESFQDMFFNDESLSLETEKYTDHNELLCSYFKEIIRNLMKKQIAGENHKSIVEHLILDNESKLMEKFLNLNENASKVFIRMLSRKRGWHRMSAITYPGISNNLNSEFKILHNEGFIDINVEEENLKTQMELLNKPEVIKLCKEFNINVKSNSSNSCRKENLINLLICDSEKQKSAVDMFKVKRSNTRANILKSKVRTYLGSCVRVNNTVFQVFYKILLLFSFAHYYDEESKRFSNELFLWLQVLKKRIKFPNYKLSETVVFETLSDFEEYKNSLFLQESFESAISNKNYNAFISAYNQAKVEFEKILENTEYQKRFLNLKPFLYKFSAGTIYAKILTRYCKTFKKQSDNLEIVNTAQLLLNQNLFLKQKKGEWYEILIKTLENQRQNNSAANLLIKSLNDPTINEVQKLTLQLRGQSILKKKTCGINDVQIIDTLNNLCILSVQEPSNIEIKGKALEGCAGLKSVYVEDVDFGKVYASVEEKAISYYKSVGFTKGYHSEGLIIQTIYFLLFFDIIYGSSPEGVFLSPYQKAPLDFYSASFFHSRKAEIELLLNEMLTWDDEQIETKIKHSYYTNYNTTCIVTWSDKFTPELFCEVIKCITMPILVSIFDRLVKNFRVYRSGFPDLTLWNPDTNTCKFVEVKSPKDKLSPAQRIWMDFLKKIGLDCEVCNVKNFSSKSIK